MIEVLLATIIALAAVGLGHYLTLRSIAHVQPSTKELAEHIKGSVTVEPDPWADEEDEDKVTEANAEEKFKETGLPRDKIDPLRFYGFQKGGIRSAVTGGDDESES